MVMKDSKKLKAWEKSHRLTLPARLLNKFGQRWENPPQSPFFQRREAHKVPELIEKLSTGFLKSGKTFLLINNEDVEPFYPKAAPDR